MDYSAVILVGGRSSRIGFNKAFAVLHCTGEETFVVPCDMPFVSGEIGKRMSHMSEGYDAVVPTWNGRL